LPRQSRSTLFPYTTLFRSGEERAFLERLFNVLSHFFHLFLCRRSALGLGGFVDAQKSHGYFSLQSLGTEFHSMDASNGMLQVRQDRKSTRLNSSHRTISYA